MFVLSRAIALFFIFICIAIPTVNFASEIEKIDINTASLEDLVKITHIGEKRAIELISLRPFSSLDDLSKINGISNSRVEDIKAQGMAFVETKETEKENLIEKINTENEKQKLDLEEKEVQTKTNEETKTIITNIEEPNKYIPIAISISLISAVLILLLKKNVKVN